MAQYRKRPVVIEAFCLGIDPMPDWFYDARTKGQIITHGTYDCLENACIKTLEGIVVAGRGDYVLFSQGEIYPCKPDIFAATYAPVEEPPHA